MRERAPREGRVAAAVLAALAVVAAGGVARAYEWFATKETQRPERWFREALTVRVSTVAPAEVPWETMEALYEEALGSWLDLPGCRLPQVDVVGTVDAADVTLPKTVDDEPDNLVVFIEDGDTWLAHEGATNSMIALTFVVANSVTGEIIDADIAVNDAAFAFTTSDDATSGVDLLSTFTHELGHFFGLDHSADPSATMVYDYGSSPSRRLQARTLEDDDIDGVCALYEVPLPEPPPSASPGRAVVAARAVGAAGWFLTRS